jgi:hypothetical protein
MQFQEPVFIGQKQKILLNWVSGETTKFNLEYKVSYTTNISFMARVAGLTQKKYTGMNALEFVFTHARRLAEQRPGKRIPHYAEMALDMLKQNFVKSVFPNFTFSTWFAPSVGFMKFEDDVVCDRTNDQKVPDGAIIHLVDPGFCEYRDMPENIQFRKPLQVSVLGLSGLSYEIYSVIDLVVGRDGIRLYRDGMLSTYYPKTEEEMWSLKVFDKKRAKKWIKQNLNRYL